MIGDFEFSGYRQITANGQTFVYDSGTATGGSTRIRVRADGRDLGKFRPGDYVRLPEPASVWDVIPDTASCSGVVKVGPASWGTARSAGTTSIVTSSSDVMQDRAYMRSYLQNLAGGAHGLWQLWNPTGSGKALVIQRAYSGDNIGAPAYAYISFVALPTLQATQGGSTIGWFSSKRNGADGGLTSVIQLRTDSVNSFVQQGTGMAHVFDPSAQMTKQRTFDPPLLVFPGQGFSMIFATNAAGAVWSYSCEWLEVPTTEL